jgi:hypothetical protein
MDKAIANKRYLFVHGGILIRDWFSDKLNKMKEMIDRIINECIKPV